jgi:hypothetical protein
MKSHRLILAIAVIMLAGIAHADSIYAVTGSLTIVGNNMCGGPCVETLNFSFDLGYGLTPDPPRDGEIYLPYWVDGTMNISSNGPLSGWIPFHTGFDATNDNYLGWVDAVCVNFCGSGGPTPTTKLT